MTLRNHFRSILSQSAVTKEVMSYHYSGQGTTEEPYLVEWTPNDFRNPTNMSVARRWTVAGVMAIATLAVSFASTAFSGAVPQIEDYFKASTVLSTLSISLFVLGFALGPMLWAPLSELYGRQILYVTTMGLMTLFGLGSCFSQNITTLLVLRFFGGATGASIVVNGAGVIADIFPAKERGFAIIVWSAAPFLGPCLGPISSGFLSAAAGWRWVDGLTVAFTGLLWILGSLVVPETYAPVLLKRRADKLSQLSGKVYQSKVEAERGSKTVGEIFSTTLQRPWIILAVEPIALLLAIYTAIVYGTLYLIFSAFPITFSTERGWSQQITSLSFLGIMCGQLGGMITALFLDKKYKDHLEKNGYAAPERRLIPCLIGGVMMPIGLFWFAFTTYPSIPWIVSLLGSSFFGFGQVLVFLSIINYIIDSYTLYAASALAANAILRALFGFAFPLFTTQMYHNLGVQWASSIPAFLALACVPFPFLFFKYGAAIRQRCYYSAESARLLAAIQAKDQKVQEVQVEHDKDEKL